MQVTIFHRLGSNVHRVFIQRGDTVEKYCTFDRRAAFQRIHAQTGAATIEWNTRKIGTQEVLEGVVSCQS